MSSRTLVVVVAMNSYDPRAYATFYINGSRARDGYGRRGVAWLSWTEWQTWGPLRLYPAP